MQEITKEWETNMSMKESALFSDMTHNKNEVWCIGNGQIAEAMTMSYEVSHTLNCMHDQMAILIIEEDEEK